MHDTVANIRLEAHDMRGGVVGCKCSSSQRMLVHSLLRLRQELTKLINLSMDKIAEPVAKATAQSTLYDMLLQGLSRGPQPTSHPKAQSEIAFWKERDEEVQRRIVSTRRQR